MNWEATKIDRSILEAQLAVIIQISKFVDRRLSPSTRLFGDKKPHRSLLTPGQVAVASK
jgi:hypothetical protein